MDTEIRRGERMGRVIRRLLPWLIGAVVLLWLVSQGVGWLGPSAQLSRLRLGTVDRGALSAVLTGSGTVQPGSDQVISSPIEARVLRVLRQPGALVEVGEPILELNVGQTTLEVGRLAGEREQKRNRRQELELLLEERLIELRSQLEVRLLEVEELEYRLEQDERLFQEGLISETQLRETRVRQRKTLIERRKVEEAIANRRQSVAAQLAGLDSEIRTLDRELAEARRKAEMATTRADRAGVLTYIVNEEGATVRPGDVLARIADPDRFRVEAVIADLHASRLAEGQEVEMPVGEETLAGRIARILPAVEEGSLRFWVELAEPAHSALRSNLRTDVLVVVDRRAEVIRVPKGPFSSGPGRQQVFVVEGATARRREVILGLAGHRHYEVEEGLAAGERVILSDMNRFLDSEEIRLR